MSARFGPGDRVRWRTSHGETVGKVVERRDSDFQFAHQRFKATKDDPAYIVESEKSGKRAARKQGALTRV